MMTCLNDDHDRARPEPQVRCDLCAQITPLDRYGLPGLSAALVDGLRALFGASRRGRSPKDDCACC
jgi:hypothetical protein